MKSVRVKLRKWLYRLVKEEQELTGEYWQKRVVPCVFCQRPTTPDSLFCAHCGFAKATRDTTGHKLPIVPPVQSPPTTPTPVTLTGQIQSILKFNPDERHANMKAWRQLKKRIT